MKAVFGILLASIALMYEVRCQDTVFWDERDTLTWDDYKANPDYRRVGHDQAVSYVGLSAKYYPLGDSAEVRVRAFFNCDKSWVFRLDSLTLVHENYHFKIAEIARRKLVKKIESNRFNKGTAWQVVKDLQKEVKYEMNKMHKDFDEAVPNPPNPKIEALYFQRIDTWLKELEEYSQDSVIIHFE